MKDCKFTEGQRVWLCYEYPREHWNIIEETVVRVYTNEYESVLVEVEDGTYMIEKVFATRYQAVSEMTRQLDLMIKESESELNRLTDIGKLSEERFLKEKDRLEELTKIENDKTNGVRFSPSSNNPILADGSIVEKLDFNCLGKMSWRAMAKIIPARAAQAAIPVPYNTPPLKIIM